MHAEHFRDLDLCTPILRALESKGYTKPTPIQAQAIPHLLDDRDLLGVAQTGTGKTAAFALPILEILAGENRRPVSRCPFALIMTPTRELAAQIDVSFKTYGDALKLKSTVIFGGVGQNPQVQALRRGVDILVATPGRLLDLMGQRHIDLSRVEIFVLDEADRMLDMGFVRDVKKVLQVLPDNRQSLLFSATMPQEIVKLSRNILHDPVRIEVTPPSSTVDRIAQSVTFVSKSQKRALLTHVLQDRDIERTLVFTRTKHGANRVAQHLEKAGIKSAAIHGNKSQGARTRALDAFRDGKLRVLVATDIAARGIDVPGITHVINFDLPNEPESYVHRIGRTARAGRDGIALSFCDQEERQYLSSIQKLIGQKIPIIAIKGHSSDTHKNLEDRAPAEPRGGGRSGGGGGRNGGGRSGGGGGGRRQRGPKPEASTSRRAPRGRRSREDTVEASSSVRSSSSNNRRSEPRSEGQGRRRPAGASDQRSGEAKPVREGGSSSPRSGANKRRRRPAGASGAGNDSRRSSSTKSRTSRPRR